MSRVAYAVRLALPPGWYEVGRDDPDAWVAHLVRQALPAGPEPLQDRLAGDLLHAVALVELLAPLDALVHLPDAEHDAVRAVLLTLPFRAGGLLRRGLPADARALERRLRQRGAARVQVAPHPLPCGPAVRLRATVRDEVERDVEQVLHVVRPPDLPVSVVLRLQWPAGHPRADELAAQADAVAAQALVEVLG